MELKIGNAACMVRTPADAKPLLGIDNSILSSITLGSFTLNERPGNAGETYWDDGSEAPTSLNSRGMPNLGYEYLKSPEFGDLISMIRASGKRARLSIAGFEVEEYGKLAKLMSMNGVDEIEFNLGCPNTGHRVASFDPKVVEEIVAIAWKVCGTVGDPYLAYKFSPFSDSYLLKEVAAVLAAAPQGAVQKVVTSNTFPNCFGLDENGKPHISAMNGYAGLGGAAMKHIALGQVRQFREALPEHIEVVGVGGASSWADTRDFYRSGASEVQIGTAFVKYGPQIFYDIAEQYADSPEAIAA